MEDMKKFLANGGTMDELMEMFRKEAEAVHAEVTKEKEAKEQHLDTARAVMLDGLMGYMEALGLIDPNEITEQDIADLTKAMKEGEKEYLDAMQVLKDFKKYEKKSPNINGCYFGSKKPSKVNEDEILAQFLASLA